MEVMIFLFSMGTIFGAIVAGVGMVLHDRKADKSGLYWNEEEDTFYFRD